MSDVGRTEYDGWYRWRCRIVKVKKRWAVEIDREFGTFGWERHGRVRGFGLRTTFQTEDAAREKATEFLDGIAHMFDGKVVR